MPSGATNFPVRTVVAFSLNPLKFYSLLYFVFRFSLLPISCVFDLPSLGDFLVVLRLLMSAFLVP